MNEKLEITIQVDKKVYVTKTDFEDYEIVRESGVTNMYDLIRVSELSGLDRETIKLIMSNYSELNEKFPEVRQ